MNLNITGETIIRAAREAAERQDSDRRVAQAEAYVRSRFYPPLPVEYGALAVLAVDLVNEGRGDERLDVSTLNPVPRGTDEDNTVSAATLVEVLRLDHMIEEDE